MTTSRKHTRSRYQMGPEIEKWEAKDDIAPLGSGLAYLLLYNFTTGSYDRTDHTETLYEGCDSDAFETQDQFWGKFDRFSNRWEILNRGPSLWRFTLNEDMGATTANQAAADQLKLDGTDTGTDITVLDPAGLWDTALNGATGLAIKHQGRDKFYIVECLRPKRLVRFTLASALATSDASKSATVTNQYGDGQAHTTGAAAITVYNLETQSSGTYVFEGDSGDAGLAYHDSGTNFRILQMECP